MRLFITALLLFSVQTAFAIPTATPEQCAIWVGKITEYTGKLDQADSLEMEAYYLRRVNEYQRRLLAGRCPAS
ncbi:MAG: hypothetical protein V7745_06400 [Pseudomonadales bacterium]